MHAGDQLGGEQGVEDEGVCEEICVFETKEIISIQRMH